MRKRVANHVTPHSEYSKELISLSRKGKCVGEENVRWMGDAVGYEGLHSWIYRKRGQPDTCESCGKFGLSGHEIHWANISGEYKRQLDDWVRLCAKCHYRMDGLGEKRWRDHIKNSERKCSIGGCLNFIHGAGLCNKHYLRKWKGVSIYA